MRHTKDDIVFACIGTTKICYDAIGPKIGSVLEEKGFTVIGTVDNQLHAKSIYDRMNEIENYKQQGKIIVGIDASVALSREEYGGLGTIKIRKGFVRPGAGVGKKLPTIGDVAILIAVGYLDEKGKAIIDLGSMTNNWNDNMAIDVASKIVKSLLNYNEEFHGEEVMEAMVI